VNVLRRAIEEPLRQIASNAGVDGAVVVEKVKAGRAPSASTRRPRSTRTSSRRA